MVEPQWRSVKSTKVKPLAGSVVNWDTGQKNVAVVVPTRSLEARRRARSSPVISQRSQGEARSATLAAKSVISAKLATRTRANLESKR